MEGEKHRDTYKILVLGDSNVGKTCLIHRYCDQAFHENYISTIGIDCKQKNLKVDDKDILLRIWDTAGQERFRTLTTAYYRGAQGIVLVYDITKSETFEHLTYWMKNISTMGSSSIGKILVGNKCDLEDNRQVKTEKAKKFAANFDVQHVETSCKLNTNIEDVFKLLAEQISVTQQNVREENKVRLQQRTLSVNNSTNSKGECAC